MMQDYFGPFDMVVMTEEPGHSLNMITSRMKRLGYRKHGETFFKSSFDNRLCQAYLALGKVHSLPRQNVTVRR